MHEQKLKIPQVAHAHLSQKGECWIWNQRFIRSLGFIPTDGNILPLDFFLFSRGKSSDANIGIIANFV